MRRSVFGPLGMRHSSYVTNAGTNAFAARGHGMAGDQKPLRNITSAKAASTLRTTAGDYGMFLQAVVEHRGLSAASIGSMLTAGIQVPIGCSDCTDVTDPHPFESVFWGLGWGLERSRNAWNFWQWGDNRDFRGFTMGSRHSGVALVMLTNSENGLSMAPAVVETIIPGPHPSFTWLDYERYEDPSRRMFNAIKTRGGAVLSEYAERLKQGESPLAEKRMNDLGYRLLASHLTEASVQAFRLNVKSYPASSNVYDSLGEALLAAGDTAGAVANYRRSVELNPLNTGAISTLASLKKE